MHRDNEARSEFAEQLCRKVSIPDGRVVASLILKTKTHEAGDDPDAQIQIDASYRRSGSKRESAYQAYAEQIRQEYAWVPEPDYRLGRRQVLERLSWQGRGFSIFWATWKNPRAETFLKRLLN